MDDNKIDWTQAHAVSIEQKANGQIVFWIDGICHESIHLPATTKIHMAYQPVDTQWIDEPININRK